MPYYNLTDLRLGFGFRLLARRHVCLVCILLPHVCRRGRAGLSCTGLRCTRSLGYRLGRSCFNGAGQLGPPDPPMCLARYGLGRLGLRCRRI